MATLESCKLDVWNSSDICKQNGKIASRQRRGSTSDFLTRRPVSAHNENSPGQFRMSPQVSVEIVQFGKHF